MQAALYGGPGQVIWREVEDPGVPGSGEVIVRVRTCGICGSDLHIFRGEAPPLAFAGGHEIAGEVVAAGSGVTGLAPGSRVAIEPIVRCGACRFCRTGQTNLCDKLEFIGFRRHGGFAECIRVPAEIAWPLPEELSWSLGALAEPLAVAVRAARLGGITGESGVAVIGGGAVGLLGALAARNLGARHVVVAVRHRHQMEAAEALGLVAVWTPAGQPAARTIAEALGDRPDLVIEAVGGAHAEPVADAIGLVRRGGTVVLTGIFTESPPVPLTRLVRKEVIVRGSYCYGRPGLRGDFETALEWLAGDPATYRRLVTHRFPLGQLETALAAAADKGSGAIKVQVEHEIV